MGDPTEQNKGEGSNDLHKSPDDHDEEDGLPPDSEEEDSEAEQMQPAVAQNFESIPQHTTNQRAPRNRSQPSANTETVHSILSSISNSNAAVVIPVNEGEDDIDAERMERFYTGALSAISKMRRQTVKAETKIETLRNEVGPKTMQAWTDEHFESLANASASK